MPIEPVEWSLTSAANSITKPTDLGPAEFQPVNGRMEVFAFRCFWLLVGYAFVRNLFAAAAKPLWYDELYTVTIAHQPKWGDIWQALSTTKDGNPPGFYFVERFFSFWVANEQISYRLASILGFCCVLVCIFLVIRATEGNWRALICTMPLLLTSLMRPYAVEARPYSLVAASVAFALICYQRAPRALWMALLGISFMAAESMHYLALFGFIPFGIAEVAILLQTRKLRWSVWIALGAGLIPVVALWPLSSAMRRFYGTHIWSPPSLFGLANMYSLLFKTFVPLALSVLAVLVVVILGMTGSNVRMPRKEILADIGGRWAATAFLGVPVYLFVFTKIMHGVYTERYALVTLLGVPLCLAFVLRMISRRGVAVLAVIVFGAFLLQELFSVPSAVREARNFVPPSRTIESMVARVGYGDLTVVVSDGQDYFPLGHYSHDASRYVFLVDAPKAAAYTGSDIVDLQFGTMRCCRPFQIYEFEDFVSRHPRFLLYSGGGAFDWWPRRLVDDGNFLQLLANDRQNHRIYLVQMKPNASR